MMSWLEDNNGSAKLTVYNSQQSVIASIFEDGEDWIFDLGVASPGELRISKTDLPDPLDWLTAYIGLDIGLEIEIEERPFLSFIDDETKAVWQVWEVIDGES